MPLDAKRVQALFLEAAQLHPAARAAFLDRECANDRELRRRVEALLRAHDEPDSMLDKSPGEAPGAPPDQETLQRIDLFIQRFEKAWQSGTPPHIDDFLPKEGPDRLAVLKELVMVDMERRGQAGTPARAEDYLERYPELARHFPTQQQDPPIQAATLSHDSASERIGMVVAGRYKFLEQIGVGGMGTVWVAEQTQPVRRKVALKLIKAGMDSKTVLARFEAERQALALMDHPNIAKVLDGGTTENGRPYFVMEYVKGIPLTKYCDDARLSIAERLALFMPVCHAVQHAHQKGIIHRDLKPSNILVCLYDGVPLPKVIDFGLAKAMHQSLTEHTLHTAHGTMMGTPLYMSPEQAELNNLDVDTRTDIYSLGVILYELLTGTTPLERKRFKEAALQEMLRLIKEEEPPRPSMRLSGSGSLPTVAAQRKLEPAKLTRLVRGDLDWIVMKALEKERGRRYETANGLSRDIQRYLSDEAVEACPPSRSYRLRKFARKNRAVLLTAAALLMLGGVAIVALVGLVVSLFYQDELKGEKAKTEQALQLEEVAHQEAETARAAEEKQRQRAEKSLDKANYYQYFHHIALAYAGWRDGSLARMEEWLDKCPIERRHWEWHYLKRLCHLDLLTIRAHTLAASAAYSPDGTKLASAGDQVVKIWDAMTGQAIRTLEGQGDFVSVAYNPDGTRLASACWDGSVRVWDTTTGEQIHVLKNQAGRCWNAIFSPDGKRLASSYDEDFSIKIWDAATGKTLLTIPGIGHGGFSIAFSPDGTQLAQTERNHVRLWNPENGQQLWCHVSRESNPSNVTFSPDGLRLAYGQSNGSIQLLNVANGQRVATFQGPVAAVTSVAFSPDGLLLASAHVDQTVRMWDAGSGKALRSFRGHTMEVIGLAFHPEGLRLASVSPDGSIKVWDAHTDQGVIRLHHTQPVFILGISPDGLQVASFRDRNIKVWDVTTGQALFTLSTNGQEVAISPDRKKRASLTGPRATDPLPVGVMVRIWDQATGQPLVTFPVPIFYGEAFSNDGRSFAFAVPGATRQIKIRALATGQDRLLDDHQMRVLGVAFSPDDTRLASASEDKTVKIWDTDTGKPIRTLEGHQGIVWGVAFSPEGRWLASAGDDNLIKIWEPATGQLVQTLQGHSTSVDSVVFSPDGQRLVSGGFDGNVKIWEAATGQEILSLTDFKRFSVGRVAFSRDGKKIAIGSEGILDGRPWTPEIAIEQEAVAVLNFLFTRPLCRGDVLDYVRHAPMLGHQIRQRALELADHYEEESDPERYWRAASNVLSRPNLNGYQYRFALRQAETACRLSPGHSLYLTTLGMAQYRTGKYREAATTLAQADLGNLATSASLILQAGQLPQALVTLEQARVLRPAVLAGLAFLAMAQQQLGADEKAQTTLARLRVVLKNPGLLRLIDQPTYLQEAEQSMLDRRQAVALVNRLAREFVLKDEIRARLREDRLLNEHLRQQALTLLEQFHDDPHLAHQVSYYDIASKPGLDAAKYQLALRLAQAAERLETADDPLFYPPIRPESVAGIAQYRLGNYRAAAATLFRADAQYQEKHQRDSAPWNLAFLVMSQHQLGEKDKARATLAGLLDLMKGPSMTNNFNLIMQDARKYVGVAQELVEGRPFIKSWLVLSELLTYEGKDGIKALEQKQLGDEAHLRPQARDQVAIAGKTLHWKEHHSTEPNINFEKLHGPPSEYRIAYAVCYIRSATDRNDLVLRVGSDDQALIYLNGDEVYRNTKVRGLVLDEDETRPLWLRQGTNVVVLKVVNQTGPGPHGSLRLVTKDGTAPEGVEYRLTP
jgi:WD40 repeat protein/serine/threonine protein kinase